MGLLDKIGVVAAGVLVGSGIVAIGEKIAENKRKADEQERLEQEKLQRERDVRTRLEQERRNTTCYFSNGISRNEFYSIVYKATKHIKRLVVSVDGPMVTGIVRSQSGISTWTFKLDFNDFGDITGNYWVWSENDDSNIPDNVGKQIQSQICSHFLEN